MRIGGLQKFSLIDYPGKLAATIFTQGCNFRCGYCHNPELVIPDCFGPVIPEEEVFKFLENHCEYLEGVVISGGEPTLQKDLIPFIEKVKQMGYLVKLDTNGSHPEVLRKLLKSNLLDYIAMDVKAPLDKYRYVVGARFFIDVIPESIELIMSSGIEYQFRTTVVRGFSSREDLDEILALIEGAQRYVVQKFQPSEKILERSLLGTEQYSDEEIYDMKGLYERGH